MLKDIRGPTIQQTGYHHANMVMDKLRDTLTSRNNEMLAMMQQAFLMPTLPTNTQEGEEVPPNYQANATTPDKLQLEMLCILCQMQQDMNNNSNNSNNNCNSNNNNNNIRSAHKTPDDATFSPCDKHEYCWTHGACNHKSGDSRSKADSHNNTATLANRMDGSNAFCTPAAQT